MTALREGDRISNYLLKARIGAGSFGEVWLARHHVFDESAAIKIPTNAEYVRNLQREGVTIHGLKHPNIVRAIDLDPYGDPPYLVMEFVDGPSLRELIDEYRAKFPIESAVTIMRGILRALSVAHAGGVIHRDIKPANVLISHPKDALADVGEQAVKVTDFGLGAVGGATTQSMMQSGSLLTDEGRSIAGTWAYMSPEQKDGIPLDGRSDLYSCGIILFEMLTGERPQGFDLPSTLRREVPPHLDEVFRRAYTRLSRRFKSADEMLGELAAGPATGRFIDAVVPPSSPPPPPPGGAVVGRCPGCQGLVEPDDQYCIRCGRQLVESVPRCPACQGYVHHSDRFCVFCGKDLGVLN